MSDTGPIVVLAGGTGGAKLARGMLDIVAPDELVVIANTGDDLEIYGAHVSPDPDLVTFWLADRIDARGWGLDGDTFHVMEGLRELGREVWFNLGDRDLAIGLDRARALAGGERLTDTHARLVRTLGVRARVLPMSDDPVRTWVRTAMAGFSPLQEFLIHHRGNGPVLDVEFRGAEVASASPEALQAIASARAIVIGPSNPVISIGPILALADLRVALLASPAPVVAISPLVGGEVLKGPTAEFLLHRRVPISGEGIATLYEGLIDGIVCDDAVEGLPSLRTDVLMADGAGRRRLATETLRFAAGLRMTTDRGRGLSG